MCSRRREAVIAAHTLKLDPRGSRNKFCLAVSVPGVPCDPNESLTCELLQLLLCSYPATAEPCFLWGAELYVFPQKRTIRLLGEWV